MKHIAVIGAGISGLTCAYELQKAGYTVVVYEANDFVGGRMSTRSIGAFPLDIGANHLANVYTRMREYVDELGLSWKPMEFLNYRVFKEGKVHKLLDLIDKKTQFKLSLLSFKARFGSTDFFELSSAVKHDTDNARHFFETRIGKDVTDYIIDPFVSTYQFHGCDEMSSGAVNAMMKSQAKYMKDWALHQLHGGMIALPQAFADKLDVRLSTPVANIQTHDNRVTLTTHDGSHTYDAVVVATTPKKALDMYTDAPSGQKDMLERTKFAATVTVGFRVPKDLMQDISIVWVPEVEGGKISGYTNEAMKGDMFVQNNETLILAWLHEDFARTLIDQSDEAIFEQTKKELMKVFPFSDDVQQFRNYDLYRWHEAMPKFDHGHLTRVKTFEDHHQGEQNVYFAGDYLNGTWTEGALRQGERVAQLIVEQNQ